MQEENVDCALVGDAAKIYANPNFGGHATPIDSTTDTTDLNENYKTMEHLGKPQAIILVSLDRRYRWNLSIPQTVRQSATSFKLRQLA